MALGLIVGRLTAEGVEARRGGRVEEPGAVISFRIYVVLKTGNEKGGRTVTVARPG